MELTQVRGARRRLDPELPMLVRADVAHRVPGRMHVVQGDDCLRT